MRRAGISLAVVAILAGSTACGLWRNAATFDEVVVQIAQRTGRNTDDVARWLRAASASEDDALRIGQGILASSVTRSTAETRVGTWIDNATSSLSAEERATVRGFALNATCDALDSIARGETPDLGSMVLNAIGELNGALDQRLLAAQLDDMLEDLQQPSLATFTARVEVLAACQLADA